MNHLKLRWLGAAIALVVGMAGTAQAAGQWTALSNAQTLGQLNGQKAGKTITIGWTSWSDAQFMIRLVKQQIESHTSLDVFAQKATIAVQYQAVAKGDIDGMIMAWMPDTHARYWKKSHAQVIDLGPMYNGAVVGLAVPDYVSRAKIDSISDLKDPRIAKQLGGVIHGIDPGAGEMRASRQAMKDYGLKDRYKLQAGSEKTMIGALSRAMQKMEPVVVTLWTPHWAFAKWNLRFLKDPKGDFSGPQHVDVLVRKGFREDYPEVARFLSNVHIPLQALQKAMYVAHQTNEKTAVSRFVANHRALVASWWFATGAEGSGGAADAAMAGRK